MSQLPSSVKKRRAKPRISRSASAAPRSPATVEKRANISVCFPTSPKILALVYWEMSWVTVKVPNAPEPLACIRRSGMTSRSKLAIFSRNQKSCINNGPLGPAVCTFWLSGTGAPVCLVSFDFFSSMAIMVYNYTQRYVGGVNLVIIIDRLFRCDIKIADKQQTGTGTVAQAASDGAG